MYEKSWRTRGLILAVALIATMLMALFYQIRFPERLFIFYRDSDGIVSHFTFISSLVMIWASYVLATIPSAFLLRREEVPHYGTLSLLAATVALLAMFPAMNLLYPMLGFEGARLWGGPIALTVTYLIGFELFTNMSRRKTWLISGGIVLIMFLINVWMYFGY